MPSLSLKTLENNVIAKILNRVVVGDTAHCPREDGDIFMLVDPAVGEVVELIGDEVGACRREKHEPF